MNSGLNEIKNERLNESYYELNHKSGLKILLYPMEGYSSAYAIFGTKYGSIDTCFKTQNDSDFFNVPNGVAHFLEHKLFESEEGDAFSRYAKTGASANAFTSFDRTCYLFSATENFKESLYILLDFVTSPYFTKESVQKEQGIIGQEIKMYEDNPDWRVFFNLLSALYQNNPVKIDIAGSVESIAQIDEKILYRCYNTFYNLNNMVLCISGGFNMDEAISVADEILKKADEIIIENNFPEEPPEVAKAETRQYLPVSQPLFNIGFKGVASEGNELLKSQVVMEIVLEIIAGECSDLYRQLYDNGLINAVFSTEVLCGRGHFACVLGGESREPQKVYERVCKEIEFFNNNGISMESFNRSKKLIYGHYIKGLGSVENVANLLALSHFSNFSFYNIIDIVGSITMEDAKKYLKKYLNVSYSSISIVEPQK